ncbi:putative P-loop containing nucleoside triphosphate hydrolase, DNA2/NAM7 helicase-like protein [Septoria linicola]|nr:putative P-loop containing nucleoside triphosphate hydrolase, DNA2/NAM7 helicase-like protein [Septoria linicola]
MTPISCNEDSGQRFSICDNQQFPDMQQHSCYADQSTQCPGTSNRTESTHLDVLEVVWSCLQAQVPGRSISVLTAYKEDAEDLDYWLRRNKMSGVNASTIDNFRGDESDITLLSLVAVNRETLVHVGHLSLLVHALSRSRGQLMIFGDFAELQHACATWRKETTALGKLRVIMLRRDLVMSWDSKTIREDQDYAAVEGVGGRKRNASGDVGGDDRRVRARMETMPSSTIVDLDY